MEQTTKTQLIMAVDDTPRNLQVIGTLLKKWGYVTVLAQNGKQCLDFLEKKQPDLILLDILMPGMDGFELCRLIKNNETTRNIPILFITALSDTENIVKGFEAGGMDYITKPFIKEEVKARIEAHLKLKQTLEQLEWASLTDAMTGVYNRRHAYRIIEREMAMAKREGMGFLLYYIDIDNLKLLNDTHGHEAGDLLITEVANIFSTAIRDSDYIFRMGGDEFMLLLPNTEAITGQSLINRLQAKAEQHIIHGIPIEFSYGLTQFDPKAPSSHADKLINEADNRMYQQKKLKKNGGV